MDNSNQQLQSHSPTPSQASMALLSPPASRYAFEPAIGTNSIPPINSILSPRANSPFIGSSGAGNTISSPLLNHTNGGLFGTSENDIPAFEPKTEIILENFTKDLKTFTNWIKNLNVEEQKTTMDIFLQNLNSEVLHYLKSKINNLEIVRSENNDCLVFSPAASASNIYQSHVRPVSPLVALNNEPTTLDQFLNDQLSPVPTSNAQSLAPIAAAAPVHNNRLTFPSNLMEPITRPRSAGPFYSDFGFSGLNTPSPVTPYFNSSLQSQPIARAFSAEVDLNNTNHFNSVNTPQNNSGNSNGNPDFAGQNAIKLNHSLSTITSRYRLDNNKKPDQLQLQQQQQQQQQLQQPPQQQQQQQQQSPHYERGRHAGRLHQFNNRQYNSQSTSLPPVNRQNHSHVNLNQLHKPDGHNINISVTGINGNNGNNGNGNIFTPIPTKNSDIVRNSNSSSSLHQQLAMQHQHGSMTPLSKSPMPKDISSIKLLSDIPSWLKALRLHKYTENLRYLDWKEMIELNDEQLADLGVGTVGARNKLLKSFATVKENLHD